MTRRAKRPPSVCSAPGCSIEIAHPKLMCRKHWFQVPRQLRLSISDAWKNKRISEWWSLCFQARQQLATAAPAAPAAIDPGSFHTGYAAIQRRMLGEGGDA